MRLKKIHLLHLIVTFSSVTTAESSNVSCLEDIDCKSATDSFYHIPNSGLKGQNIEELYGTVESCAAACLDSSRSEWCVSFDYQKYARYCFLQNQSSNEVKLSKGYTNDKFDHYGLKTEHRKPCEQGESCSNYIELYKKEANYALSDRSIEELEDISREGCAIACLAESRSDWCVSFDYNIMLNSCVLRSKRKKDVDPELFYPTNEYDFYELKNVIYWYEKTVWKVVMIGSPILLIFAYFQLKNRRLRKRTDELEKVVTKRTKLIKDQNKELKRLNKARSIFFTNVSHELRTPLTLTIMPLDEILKGQFGEVSDKISSTIKVVLRNAKGMKTLIDQVLDLSSMENNSYSLSIQPVCVSKLIKDECEIFEVMANSREVNFTLDLIENSLFVEADPDALKCVFKNILSNAFKFTPKRGNINVSSSYDNDILLFEVKDSGCGISESEIPFVFDKYYQAESDGALYSGTGIGLALVSEYTKLHGGEVSVKSSVGFGSIFSARIPLSKSEMNLRNPSRIEPLKLERNNEKVNRVSELQAKSTDKELPVVLFVEDNEELKNFLINRFSDSYRVISAENGSEGHSLAKQHIPDVIITDQMMPLMDGNQLVNTLKSDSETDFIPILMLTAKAQVKDIAKSIELGADDYLTKPFAMVELIARVHRLIESRKSLKKRYSSSAIGNTVEEQSLLGKIKRIVLSKNGSVSVSGLADQLAMDRTTLYRKLKEQSQKTPNEVIKSIRMEEAATLMNENSHTVCEIAYGVGFSSVGNFSRSFTSYFGVSPSEYKKAAASS